MKDRIPSIAVMAGAALLAAGGVVAIASGKKIDNAELRRKLTPMQYQVTQKEGTEPPFKNEYWDNKAAGIYVDVVSGEALFSSTDKFKSGTGWPSFSKPLAAENVVERTDRSLFMKRTEVRSKGGDSHLGHVFDDGPKPAGLRYCINSASLRFIAAADLKKEGYGKYASRFAGSASDQKRKTAKATFAGGCFWCMEHPFEKLDGVSAVISGYTGGKEKDPSYKEVSAGATGHAEAVEITYDPEKVSYEKLLDVFWMQIDPTTPNRQFADRGAQYRTGIFYHDEAQKKLALASLKKLDASGRYPSRIVTEIVPASEFTRAEEYHQDYYKKNPIRYKAYRYGSGRDRYLKKIWKK